MPIPKKNHIQWNSRVLMTFLQWFLLFFSFWMIYRLNTSDKHDNNFLHLYNTHRFHQSSSDMRASITIAILLVYFAQNVCFCAEDAAPKVFVPPEKYRLPRTIFPELYKLNILTHINDDEGFKFYGDVRIKVNLFGLLTGIFPLKNKMHAARGHVWYLIFAELYSHGERNGILESFFLWWFAFFFFAPSCSCYSFLVLSYIFFPKINWFFQIMRYLNQITKNKYSRLFIGYTYKMVLVMCCFFHVMKFENQHTTYGIRSKNVNECNKKIADIAVSRIYTRLSRAKKLVIPDVKLDFFLSTNGHSKKNAPRKNKTIPSNCRFSLVCDSGWWKESWFKR